MTTTTIGIEHIRVSDDIRPRESISRITIQEYAEAYDGGATLPPIVVYRDPDDAFWLSDGWHRYLAQRQLQRVAIDAEIREGSKADAMLHAAGANVTHGRRREKGDAVQAAKVAIRALHLKHPEKRPTYEAVMEAAFVSHGTAAKAFEELESAGEDFGQKDARGRPSLRNSHHDYSSKTSSPTQLPNPPSPPPPDPPSPRGTLPLVDLDTGEILREEKDACDEPSAVPARTPSQPAYQSRVRSATQVDRARVAAKNARAILEDAHESVLDALEEQKGITNGTNDLRDEWASTLAIAVAIAHAIRESDAA